MRVCGEGGGGGSNICGEQSVKKGEKAEKKEVRREDVGCIAESPHFQALSSFEWGDSAPCFRAPELSVPQSLTLSYHICLDRPGR